MDTTMTAAPDGFGSHALRVGRYARYWPIAGGGMDIGKGLYHITAGVSKALEAGLSSMIQGSALVVRGASKMTLPFSVLSAAGVALMDWKVEWATTALSNTLSWMSGGIDKAMSVFSMDMSALAHIPGIEMAKETGKLALSADTTGAVAGLLTVAGVAAAGYGLSSLMLRQFKQKDVPNPTQ